MKRGKEHLQFWAMMGMELSWRYAWANFLMTSNLHRPFPFPEAVVTFALAAATTFLSKGRGWRVIYILSSQVFGFILVGLRIVYLFNSWPSQREGKPFGPVLVSILRFLFMGRAVRPEPSSSTAEGGMGELMTPRESSWGTELFEKILTWVFGSLLGLTLVIISCGALFFLVRWLLSRTASGSGGERPWHFFSLWLGRCRALLASLWAWMTYRRNRVAAIQLFAALRTWRRRSRLPHALSETPTGYGLRLKKGFHL